jgi:hypothetical protein
MLVDTREKLPWDWEPDDAFESVKFLKLDAGDYTLEGLEKIVAVERKASVDELFINFTKDKDRIKAEFERLKDHKFKILMLEFSCEDMMNPTKYYINKRGINRQHPKMPVAVVAEGVTKLMMEYGVHVIFGGSRAQTMTRGLLLKAYELHGKGLL